MSVPQETTRCLWVLKPESPETSPGDVPVVSRTGTNSSGDMGLEKSRSGQQAVSFVASGKRTRRRLDEGAAVVFLLLFANIAKRAQATCSGVEAVAASGRASKSPPAFGFGAEGCQGGAMRGLGGHLLAFVSAGGRGSMQDTACEGEARGCPTCWGARSCPKARRRGHGTGSRRQGRPPSPSGHRSDPGQTLRTPGRPGRWRSDLVHTAKGVRGAEDTSSW